MQRCLELARLGIKKTSPNPMVGCVLVSSGQIISEGWHQGYGLPHAEVNAISKLNYIPGDTILYVNLEPCNHHGKTPPCTELIIRSGIKKVVIGSRDLNPLVSGQGIQHLRKSGIEVLEGILEEASRACNHRFFNYYLKGKAFIWGKIAKTENGATYYKESTRMHHHFKKKISGWQTHLHTHLRRSIADAIVIGVQTLVEDQPKLDNRFWEGGNPRRFIYGDPRKFTGGVVPGFATDIWIWPGLSDQNGIELLGIKELNELEKAFFRAGYYNIMVEGGEKTLKTFEEAGVLARKFEWRTDYLSGLDVKFEGIEECEGREWAGSDWREEIFHADNQEF